jgi:hypothetical protein
MSAEGRNEDLEFIIRLGIAIFLPGVLSIGRDFGV